jgi:hypothetical protein
MYCTTCGTKRTAEATYCPNCGNPLTGAKPPSPKTVPTIPAEEGPYVPSRRTQWAANVSLLLGIVAPIMAGFVDTNLALVLVSGGITFGIMGLLKAGEGAGGAWKAWVGLALSIVTAILLLAGFANQSDTKADSSSTVAAPPSATAAMFSPVELTQAQVAEGYVPFGAQVGQDAVAWRFSTEAEDEAFAGCAETECILLNLITSPDCHTVSINYEAREILDGPPLEKLQKLVEVNGDGVTVGAPVLIELGSENATSAVTALDDIRCVA